MYKEKKGQLTLFVIIAVVIVIAVIIYFYLQGNLLGQQKYDPKVELVRENVLDCLQRNYGQSLELIGIQGGYLDVPNPYEESLGNYINLKRPYYYHEGEVKYPSLQDVEKNIAELATVSSEYCFNIITEEESDTTTTFSNPNINIQINEKDIIFTAISTMTVDYNNKTAIVDLSESQIILESDMKGMHEISTFISDYYKNNAEWTPYSDILTLSQKNNVYVNLVDSADGFENTVEITKINEENIPSTYVFKNKFNHETLGEVAPLLA